MSTDRQGNFLIFNMFFLLFNIFLGWLSFQLNFDRQETFDRERTAITWAEAMTVIELAEPSSDRYIDAVVWLKLYGETDE